MDEPLIELYNYGDAGADCVVKTIVDSAQKSTGKAKTDQLVEGLKLPDVGESMMMIVGAVILIGLMAMSSGGGGNGIEGKVLQEAAKTKRFSMFSKSKS